MLSNRGNTIAVGLCKRCGKVIEYSPVPIIRRDLGPSCITVGQNSARELQSELYKNAKYCRECSKEVRRALFRRLLSLPKHFIKSRE